MKRIATLQEVLTLRAARMGDEIARAQVIGHTQTFEAGTLTCTCGHASRPAPNAQTVVAGIHAREALGALVIPTVA